MSPVLRRYLALLGSFVVVLGSVVAFGAALAQTQVSLTRLTYSSQGTFRRSELPSVSCDGTRIAFKSTSDFHNEGLPANYYIWLYDVQTMALTRLTPRINSLDFSDEPSISAAGAKIAFVSDNDFLGQGIVDGQQEVWLATTNPVTVTRLTSSPNSAVFNRDPGMSPDGSHVTFVGNWDFLNDQFLSGSDLWRVDTGTKQITRLVHAIPAGRHVAEPDVSVDGTRIVFRSNGDFFGQGIPNTSSRDIWLYDTVAMTLTQITNDVANSRNSLWPSISGDGTKIVFVSSANFLNDGVSGSHLWLYHTNTQTYTRVTAHPNWPTGVVVVRDPEISLDGNVIAFSSVYNHIQEQLNDDQEIWLYDIPSSTFTRVTTSTNLPSSGPVVNNLEPSASGDSAVVAFQSNVDFLEEGNIGAYEIWRAEITPTTAISSPPPLGNQVFLPLVRRSGSGSPPVIWEDDNFDGLVSGELDGQNGWFRAAPDRASAIVAPSGGGGKLLHLDPGSDETIVMGKDVPDQLAGQHIIRVRVLVEAPHLGSGCNFFDLLAPLDSLAKIEVRTNPSGGWEKKFQLYFGSRTMRINYGPSLYEAVTIVPRTQLGHWYNIQVNLDLSTELADVWVDGVLAASDVRVHAGPIVDVGLSGWDLPGYVQLDDLHGIKQ